MRAATIALGLAALVGAACGAPETPRVHTVLTPDGYQRLRKGVDIQFTAFGIDTYKVTDVVVTPNGGSVQGTDAASFKVTGSGNSAAYDTKVSGMFGANIGYVLPFGQAHDPYDAYDSRRIDSPRPGAFVLILSTKPEDGAQLGLIETHLNQ